MAALGGGGERDLCMEEDMEAMEASIEGWKGKGNMGLAAAVEVTGLGNPGGNPPVAAAAAARAAKAFLVPALGKGASLLCLPQRWTQ